jgi:hypothetical protein
MLMASMSNVQLIAIKVGIYASAEVIMREAGKGSRARPFSVDKNTFDKNWDAIFNRPDPRVLQDAENEDEAFRHLENQINKGKQDADKK